MTNRVSSIGTVGSFMKGRACSDTLFHVLNQAFQLPRINEERAAMPFAGGIMQHGYQCGMIWGAALAAGVQAHRLFGAGPKAETKAIIAAKRLEEAFRGRFEHTSCFELTSLDKSSSTLDMVNYFVIRGGTIGCFRMAAHYAPIAYDEIRTSLAKDAGEVPCSPVSCASLLARKMGASEAHAHAVAGFAGGIGLSGGACGALGAAIWLIALASLEQGAQRATFKDPKTAAVIEAFLKASDYEFECSKVVGRNFDTVGDHAAYLQDGGCAKLIEVLSADRGC